MSNKMEFRNDAEVLQYWSVELEEWIDVDFKDEDNVEWLAGMLNAGLKAKGLLL